MLEGELNLIAQAARGDGGAFGALYDHYHAPIYRFIYLKVGRREEAEDIAHQVFMHAWQHIPSYKDQGYPLSSWLYRIARNAVIDHYRTRKDTSSLDEMDSEAAASDLDIEAAAETALLLAEIKKALAGMKPVHQDVLILRFVDELSLKETAEALGRSEGAVKLLQHRATRELKKRIDLEKNPFLENVASPETI